jgi:ribosomal protein S18 acetylase RimI-like enzyme
MPEIEIRPAVSADLPVLTRLDHSYQTMYVWQMDRTIEEGQVSFNFREIRLPRAIRVDYPYDPNALTREWSQQSTILIACMDAVPLGYARLKERILPDSLWISDLVVRPDVRRKGIASGLALAAQDWAGQHDLRRVVMEMQSKNYPAIRFAMKLGYEFCGYHDHFYSNRDIALFFARNIH